MEGIQEKIRAHSIWYIAQCAPKYLAGMLLLPLLTFFVVLEHVPLWLSGSWVIASYLLALLRYLMIVKIKPLPLEELDITYWGRMLTLTSFASGCLWGLAVVLFFVPDSLGVQLYMYLTVFAMTSMTMILYAYWISAYYAFALPSLAGVFTSLVMEGSAEYYAFAAITVLFATLVIQVARSQRLLANESLELRFRQGELMEELKMQKEAAESANLSKSKFLAAASHDLRQPLHSIGLFTAALGNRSIDAEERALIENIDSAVVSLDSLLNSLLDISKLDAGVISPKLEHISLSSTVQNLATEYEPQARAKGLSWTLHGSDAVARSDPGLLDTILRNLISNAIRYTDTGSITIAFHQDSDGVTIEITDSGIGIPASRQSDIFQEFFQLSNPGRDSAKGVGLGLAIVDRLARLLEIGVTLQSKPGEGTAFTLRVPGGRPEKISPSAELKSTGPHDGTGTFVLVIDNNPEILSGMKALLKSWHYRVVCAVNETRALRALSLAGQNPDIVIADYQLDRGQTGVQVLKSLTAQLETPFDAIILTGDTSQQCMLDAYRNRYKVLHKPVPPGKLRAMLIGLKLKS